MSRRSQQAPLARLSRVGWHRCVVPARCLHRRVPWRRSLARQRTSRPRRYRSMSPWSSPTRDTRRSPRCPTSAAQPAGRTSPTRRGDSASRRAMSLTAQCCSASPAMRRYPSRRGSLASVPLLLFLSTRGSAPSATSTSTTASATRSSQMTTFASWRHLPRRRRPRLRTSSFAQSSRTRSRH